MNFFCIDCGARFEEFAKFCSACGTPRALQFPPPAPADQQAGNMPPARSGVRLLTIVVSTLLFAALLGLGSCVYVAMQVTNKSMQFAHSLAEAGEQALNVHANPTPADSSPEDPIAAKPTDGSARPIGDPSQISHCSATAGTPPSDQLEVIPLRPGLTIVDAWHVSEGDYELVESVESVVNGSVRIFLSDTVERIEAYRTICGENFQHARVYNSGFRAGDPEVFPAMTQFSFSTDEFTDLKTKGRTSLTYTQRVPDDDAELLVQHTASRRNVSHDAFAWDEWTGEIARVEPNDVQVPMIVNDQRVQVPALHAKGMLGKELTEFWILDDPRNPVTLRFAQPNSDFSLQVVKLSFPGGEAPKLEQSLKRNGTVELHGIYFDFGSDQIRGESEPVLKEIAEALTANPAWNLKIEGHTDNIGGDQYNQALSERRAAAVKAALVKHYQINAFRLTTAGFGASQPKESNDTLAGRARNRRVELIRQ